MVVAWHCITWGGFREGDHLTLPAPAGPITMAPNLLIVRAKTRGPRESDGSSAAVLKAIGESHRAGVASVVDSKLQLQSVFCRWRKFDSQKIWRADEKVGARRPHMVIGRQSNLEVPSVLVR